MDRVSLLLPLVTFGCAGGEVKLRLPVEPEDTGVIGPILDSGAPADSDPVETGEPAALPYLCINEILADNVFSYEDEVAGRADLIELFNGGETAVSVAGYGLSDDPDAPFAAVLDEGLVIEPRGHLLLFADDAPARGFPHLPFKLSRGGETLTLTAPDGRIVDQVSYVDQATDWSAARTPDGSTTWAPAAAPTPGEPNLGVVGEPDAPGGPLEQVEAPPDLSEAWYSDDAILQVELEISESGLIALTADPYTYVRASLTVDGRLYTPVAARCKGENSFLPITTKCSLKIKLDAYLDDGALYGMREITLNNMSNDPSMMHERIAYRLYREAGVPAARSNHAWVLLNGEPYGLFANVETVNRDLVARWYADPDGDLWELHDVDFTDAYISSFTPEYGPDDRSDLVGSADALELSGEEAISALSDHMSVGSFLDYWAVSAVVGQFDSYPYSSPGDDAHIFDSPASGVLEWLPHGVDETFSFPSNDVTAVNGVVARRCLEAEVCRTLWMSRVWDMQGLAEEIDLYGYAADVKASVSAYVSEDPNRPYSSGSARAAQDELLQFIAGRADALPEWVGPRP